MPYLRITVFAIFLFSCLSSESRSTAKDALRAVSSECSMLDSGNSRFTQIDSLLRNDSDISVKSALTAVLNTMSDFTQQKRYNEVIIIGMSCTDIFAKCEKMTHEEVKLYIHLLDQFGFCCQALGLYSELNDSYLRALDLARREGFENEQAILMNNIGSLYYRLEDFTKARQMFNDAIKINERLENKENLFINYNNLSAVHLKLNDSDAALEFIYLALHQIDKETDDDKYKLLERNIANIYSRKGMKRYAIGMIRDIADYQESNNQVEHLLTSYQMLGNLYFDTNQLDSAQYFFQKSIRLYDESNSTINNVELFKKYAEVNNALGDRQQAYESMAQYAELRDSIYQRDSKNRINGLLSLYEEQQRQNKAIQEVYRKESRFTTLIIITSSALLLVLLILCLYFRKRLARHNLLQKRKFTKILRRKTDAIAELESKIYELEYSHGVEQNNELADSMQNMRDHEFVVQAADDMGKLLLKVNPKSTEIKNEIREMHSRLRQYEAQNGIDEFSATFGKIHPDFYDNLVARFGSFTSKELRLCALIRLGLSTKSIADITFREPRSVESARNRLRKKFGLQQQEDLAEFLMQF